MIDSNALCSLSVFEVAVKADSHSFVRSFARISGDSRMINQAAPMAGCRLNERLTAWQGGLAIVAAVMAGQVVDTLTGMMTAMHRVAGVMGAVDVIPPAGAVAALHPVAAVVPAVGESPSVGGVVFGAP
jgi:hypothetical protein